MTGRIQRIRVESFGGLSDIDFTDIASVAVVCGPNEAGKSTLVEFIRRQYFGLLRPQTKDHYLSTVETAPQGWMELHHLDSQAVRVARTWPKGRRTRSDEMQLLNAASLEPLELSLSSIVGDVEPSLFDHVFCLSVDDLHGIDFLDSNQYLERLLGGALFGSATSPTRVESSLDAQRDDLVKVRGSARINDLATQFDDVTSALHTARQAQVSAATSRTEAEALQAELDELTKEVSELRARQAEIDTSLTLLPLVGEHRVLRQTADTRRCTLSVTELEDVLALAQQWQTLSATVARLESTPTAPSPASPGELREMVELVEQFRLDASRVTERAERRASVQRAIEVADRKALQLGERLGNAIDVATVDQSLDARQRVADAAAAVTRAQVAANQTAAALREAESDAVVNRPVDLTEDALTQRLASLEREVSFDGSAEAPSLRRIVGVTGAVAVGLGLGLLMVIPAAGVVTVVLGGLAAAWGLLPLLASREPSRTPRPENRGEAEQIRLLLRRVGAARRADAEYVEALGHAARVIREVGLGATVPGAAVDAWDTAENLTQVQREAQLLAHELVALDEDDALFDQRTHEVARRIGIEPATPDVVSRVVAQLEPLRSEYETAVAASGEVAVRLDEVQTAIRSRDAVADQLSAIAAELSTPVSDLVPVLRDEIQRARAHARIDEIEAQFIEAVGPDRSAWKFLEATDRAVLEVERTQVMQRIAEREDVRTERIERRAALVEQRRAASSTEDVFDLDARRGEIVAQAADELRRLVHISVARAVIKETFADYERHHQPEVFRRAAELFRRVTGGGYSTIVTTKDDHGATRVVVVDRSDRTWDVGHLSRGTREQLYLCVRLALAEHLASAGVRMPLLLDDVMVDFDAQRAHELAVLTGEVAQTVQVIHFTTSETYAQVLVDKCRASRFDLPPRRH